jgi:nucleolar protein 9
VTGLTPLRLLQIDRLLAQNMDDLLAIAHSPIASRLIDAILDTPAVPFKLARRVILNFIDSFFPLVDDRLGSRVGENIWSKCDGFLKVRRPLRVKSFACLCLLVLVSDSCPSPSVRAWQEKIAKSLAPFEISLAESQYGRFFGRKLNLNFYKRKPQEWRRAQTAPEAIAPAAKPEADELDAIFALAPAVAPVEQPATTDKEARKAAKRAKKAAEAADVDESLSSVLGAIRESASGGGGGGNGAADKAERKRRKKAAKAETTA